jgi:indole-3-glycerol phosphate synthase
MTILDKIIAEKQQEVSGKKREISIHQLEKSSYFSRQTISLKTALQQSNTGIIAEFKRKSPSKGWIAEQAQASVIPLGYQQAGATGLSILTDTPFFGGQTKDILDARQQVTIPILRKDFMIDEYQLIEAKAMGADVILLIAAALSPKEVLSLAKMAHSLSLEVLLEIHNEQELAHICSEVDMVGVNNRNLKDFIVDIQYSFDLVDKIPNECVKISESGLQNPTDVLHLRRAGYQGFLMGETFMKTVNPEKSLATFMQQLNAN